MKSPVVQVKRSVVIAVAALALAALPRTTGAAGVGGSVLEAARRHDLEGVRALLRTRADVNATQPDGATALHWAAHWNDVPMAEALLQAGARVSQANEYGATPLWLACVNGSAPMAEVLLQRGADPNAGLKYGETPLMTAARGGAVAVVQTLLAHGANVQAKEASRGQTALMWAAAEGHVDVMRALVEGSASVTEPSTSGFTPLMFVARQGSVDAARLLLDHGAAIGVVTKSGATALLTAVMRGHVDLAEFLLDHGAAPDQTGRGHTALHWAAGTWETPLTTDYLFTDEEWAPLRGVPADRKLRMIKALVAHGANINARTDREPMRTGYTLIGSFPQQLRRGATPFYIAAVTADVDVMRQLVSLGADPGITSANNTTPLMVAAGRMRLDYESRVREEEALAAVKLAIELGNDINSVNDAGETPLHAAVYGGFNKVVEYLVEHGASLNARTKDGKTPLAIADEGYRIATLLITRPSTADLLRKLGAQ